MIPAWHIEHTHRPNADPTHKDPTRSMEDDGRWSSIWFELAVSAAFLGFFHLLMLGDFAWMYLVLVWSIGCAMRVGWHPESLIPLLVGAAVLTAHMNGYKIYGSATTLPIPQGVLQAAHFDHFEAPNVVVAEDGTRHTLANLTFDDSFTALPPTEQFAMLFLNAKSARFAPASEFPSGYAVYTRRGITCGNALAPTLFPDRVPAYMKRDLGAYLHAATLNSD